MLRFLLKKTFVYLKNRQRDSTPICWFTPQMSAIVPPWCRPSWETGIHSRSPMWVQGDQSFELSPLPPRVCKSRKLSQEWGQVLNPGSLIWDMVSLKSNTCPENFTFYSLHFIHICLYIVIPVGQGSSFSPPPPASPRPPTRELRQRGSRLVQEPSAH